MRILALDTSTLTASVAVTVDGKVAAEQEVRVVTHSERLLPLVDAVLAAAGLTPAQLDLVACGAGPGSFTGLRIGLATAKGLCFALGKPLVVASSLAALALEAEAEAEAETAGAGEGAAILALLDARRGEVYAGLYRLAPPGLMALADERVLPPEDLPAYAGAAGSAARVLVVGDGAAAYPEAAARAGRVLRGHRMTPRAAAVARLAAARHAAGVTDEIATSTPTYIRNWG